MARVKLSAIFTAIRGRYGGGVFRDWNGRTTLAARQSSLKNHYTPEQVNFREALGFLSKAWSTLSFSEKDAWEEVAVYLSTRWGHFNNEVGTKNIIRTPRGPFTGIDALISVHCLLRSSSLWSLTHNLIPAPIGVTAPTPCIINSFTAAPTILTVFYETPSNWGTNARAGRIRVWVKSENGVFYTQMNISRGAGASFAVIRDIRMEGSGQPAAPGKGVFYVQVDAVNREGLVSSPSNLARAISS